MISKLLKRKIEPEKLANVFVNSIFEISENGFQDIKEMISEDPAFVYLPNIKDDYSNKFLLILIVGNLAYLKEHFEVEDATEIRKLILSKFSTIYEISYRDFERLLDQTSSFISQVNHPSKNLLYGMSKAIFHEFELNQYQEDYFKNMRTPNPLFLKRMDEIMSNFLWDWDQFFKKHKLHLN